MTNGRDFHSATLLPSCDVVIAGGNSFFSISSVELYNQTSGTFTGAGSLSTPRHFHTATLLPSGKVLFVGGVNEFSGQESPEFSVLWSAGLFDPNSTSSLFTGGLGTQRFRHAAALLNNGHRMGRDSPDSRGVTCTSLYVRNLMVPSNPYIIISISATTVINISGPDWNARSYASRKSNDSLHR